MTSLPVRRRLAAHRRPIVTLTTDFGDADGYVAAMKGVILSINPDTTIVDVTHAIRPQDVASAAFLLGSVVDAFPPDVVHVVIVDPGVGGKRRAVAVQTARTSFVGPDNGVLSWALAIEHTTEWPSPVRGTRLPPGIIAVELTERRFWRGTPSATFHGRDVFAPVAAHLARGVPLRDLGRPVESLQLAPIPEPAIRGPGELLGHIVHVDRFGNLISDVRADLLRRLVRPRVSIDGQDLPMVTHYAEATGLAALIGSAELLEIALPNGSAAAALGRGVGAHILVRHDDG